MESCSPVQSQVIITKEGTQLEIDTSLINGKEFKQGSLYQFVGELDCQSAEVRTIQQNK